MGSILKLVTARGRADSELLPLRTNFPGVDEDAGLALTQHHHHEAL